MTGNMFNKELKGLLGQFIDYDEKRNLAHSFRAGFASMMAAADYSDEQLYCKTGRSSRLKEQRDFARTITLSK